MTMTETSPGQKEAEEGAIMRVLVAADGSQPAVDACRMLARPLPAGSDVRLLTVLSFSTYPYSLIGGHLSDESERAETAKREAARMQAEAREILEKAGFEVSVVHRFGYAPDEIISELEEYGADMVVLGHRNLHAPARWASSVSDRVIHRSKTPVLLVA